MLAGPLITACSSSSNSDAIFVKQDLVIALLASEEKLPKDKERVDHYFALLGETPFQIPLLQPVKGEDYTLFAALPIGNDINDIERNWSLKGQDFEQIEKKPWKFSWKNRDTLNYKVIDLIAQRDESVIYFLIAQPAGTEYTYNADSLISRLHSLHHTP